MIFWNGHNSCYVYWFNAQQQMRLRPSSRQDVGQKLVISFAMCSTLRTYWVLIYTQQCCSSSPLRHMFRCHWNSTPTIFMTGCSAVGVAHMYFGSHAYIWTHHTAWWMWEWWGPISHGHPNFGDNCVAEADTIWVPCQLWAKVEHRFCILIWTVNGSSTTVTAVRV
jgi:hypothetical protein